MPDRLNNDFEEGIAQRVRIKNEVFELMRIEMSAESARHSPY
jgi:hypothetical protein